MAANLIGGRVEAALPVHFDGGGPFVALRSWLIAPERLPLDRLSPMLTGLFGYPWRTGQLDARCTVAGRLDRDFGLPPRIESHHPIVPELECSCGVYAVREKSVERVTLSSPVGVPLVTGFVELSGRILTGKATYRAQQAAIVGPLTIQPGRPPIAARLLRRSIHPQRVAILGSAYLVRWSARPPGQAWKDWVTETARELQSRYEVEVIV